MEKKTEIILASIIVTVILVGIIVYYTLFQKQQDNPLSSLEYVNAGEGWGINPPEGWTRKQYSLQDGIEGDVTFEPLNTSGNVKLGIFYQTTFENDTLNRFVEQELYFCSERERTSGSENYSLISHNERTVNNMNAYEFVEHIIFDGDWKSKTIFVENYNRIFMIQFIAKSELYFIYEPFVEDSLDTFVIVEMG